MHATNHQNSPLIILNKSEFMFYACLVTMLKRSYQILKSSVLAFTFSGLLKGVGIQIFLKIILCDSKINMSVFSVIIVILQLAQKNRFVLCSNVQI